VLLHGGGQTRHAWRDTAQRIAACGYHAITVDHRGHGDSDWHPAADYSFGGFTADVTTLVDTLHQPPVLVGASLGGIVSVIAASDRSKASRQFCRGIVLVDVTPRLQVGGVARILEFMQAHPDGFASLEEAAAHVAAFLPHRAGPPSTAGLEKNLRRTDDGRYKWHWDPRMMGTAKVDPTRVRDAVENAFAADGDPWGRIRRLAVPLLLIRGRMSDVVSEEDARALLEAAPHTRYVDIAGAAHMVAGDRNDVFADAVITFLGAVGQGHA
jgi:pimeloyl-ACP methyl ester carboxylesterase